MTRDALSVLVLRYLAPNLPHSWLVYAIDAGAPLAYYPRMIFVETPVFEQQINDLLSHDEYLAFQKMLAGNPTAGDVIKGSGGLRKIRWSLKGAGKRGGIRVIYYHVTAAFQIRLLLAYKKSEQDDLTPAQLRVLRRIVEAWEE